MQDDKVTSHPICLENAQMSLPFMLKSCDMVTEFHHNNSLYLFSVLHLIQFCFIYFLLVLVSALPSRKSRYYFYVTDLEIGTQIHEFA